MKCILALLYTICFLSGIAQTPDTTVARHVVYFPINRSTPPETELNALKTWLSAQDKATNIVIKGFTDTTGSKLYNQRLSAKRATTIAALLYDFDKTQQQIQVLNYGEDELASFINQKLNRRVEIEWTTVIENAVPDTLAALLPDTVLPREEPLPIPALQSILFVPNKAIIEPSALSYVQELAIVLSSYKGKAVFEIRGHVNCNGTRLCHDSAYLLYLDRLSERRAKEVYDHLVGLGVPASRLRYKGMGNRQMIYPAPANEAEMRKNIRVEVVAFPE